MKPFDNYEIHGCRTYAVPGDNGVEAFAEQCPDSEAEYWTLFGHIPGQGLETIRDFPTREDAEEMFFRITGMRYACTEDVQERLQVMHAGERLLGAMKEISSWLVCFQLTTAEDMAQSFPYMLELSDEAIAEATDGTPSQPEPILIEVRGGVVVDVQNVPLGYQYEVRDHDEPEAADEATEGAA